MMGRDRRWEAWVAVIVGFAAAVALVAPRSTALAAASLDTGVVDISKSPDMAEGEVPLAVDPLNPLHVAAASNTWAPALPPPLAGVPGLNGLMMSAVYTSHDGGRTWRTQAPDHGGVGRVANPLAVVPGSPSQLQDPGNVDTTDADVAWDRHGNLYFDSGAAHNPNHQLDEVATVWRSADGGDTWYPPSTAISSLHQEHEELDRPWLALDNSGGLRDGNLYIAFETGAFTDDPPKVFVKASTDHAATWGATVRVDDGTYQTQFNPRNRPVVDGGGTLYIAYDRAPITSTPVNPQVAPIQLVVATSADGAQTFQRTVVDDNITRVQSPDEALASYSEMIPALAADPNLPGRLAVVWPQAIDANNSRVMLRYTTDGGAHWSPRVDVADDPATLPDQHDHVALRWLPDGRLAVGWRDRRNGGGAWAGNFQEWVRLFALDGQRALQPVGHAIELTSGPQLAEANFRGPTMPDEYQGLTATGTAIMASWTQVAGTYTDVVFRSMPLSAFDAPALPVLGGGGGSPNTGTGPSPLPLSLSALALLLLLPRAIARHQGGDK